MYPVLLTFPRYKMILRRGKGSNDVFYYIPYENRYVNSKIIKKVLSKYNITTQEYYDRWFLNITVPSERPRCKNCDINVGFIGVYKGYHKYCNNKCSRNSDERRESLKPYYESGGAFGDIYRNKNGRYDETLNKLSNNLLNGVNGYGRVMKNPLLKKEYMDKNPTIQCGGLTSYLNINNVKYKESLNRLYEFRKSGGSLTVLRCKGRIKNSFKSRISSYLFSELNKILKYYNIGELEIEKPIIVDGIYRRLDSYHKELNKWIEFNGDYWHSNPSIPQFWINNPIRSAEKWNNDRVRNKSISKVLGIKPLIIWEYSYKTDKYRVISKCISYLMGIK